MQNFWLKTGKKRSGWPLGLTPRSGQENVKKINFSFWLWFMVKYDLKRVLPKKIFLPQTPPPTPPPCASVLKKSGICHNFQAHDCFLWMLCARTCPCFFLRAAALNVQIRMEDGMDESKYKASFDGQLGAGTAGPGANFAWPPAVVRSAPKCCDIGLLQLAPEIPYLR